MSRRLYDSGNLSFISDISLLLIDEVHLLCENRGPTLEAGVVCRLKALGCMPQLQSSSLARLRIIAVSATIPNIGDIVAWLGVQAQGCKQFGEEMRPVQINTIVNGYGASKNDFLFERGLNDKVFQVVAQHWNQKPVLAFCSSRKGMSPCHACDRSQACECKERRLYIVYKRMKPYIVYDMQCSPCIM
jgi:ATP-dependent DNA helicase HFM1/MER3